MTSFRSSGSEELTEVSTQPRPVSPCRRVSDAEWQALLTGVRQMAGKVAGLSHRMAAVEYQLNPDGRQASARRRPSDR
jgi:hypothetical protein